MYVVTCYACGLDVQITEKGERQIDSAASLEKCMALKLKAERGDRTKPLDEQLATCPHLNASIRRAT